MSRKILMTVYVFIAAVTIIGNFVLAWLADAEQTQQQVVRIDVTSAGFEPSQVKTEAGQPIKLVATRRTDSTCVKDIVIKDFGIDKSLPLDQPVEITFTPPKPGQVRYACAMNMVAGVIIVK